jgi:outer membrane lipoprotein-sorting protein
MRPLCLALLPPLLAGPPNEAEKLFRDMEEKILAAKVFAVKGEMQVDGGKGDKSRVEVSLLLGQGNKARVKVTTHVGADKHVMRMVSNGTKVQIRLASGGKPREVSAPRQLHQAMALTFTRLGLTAGPAAFRPRPPGAAGGAPESLLQLAAFKTGTAAKVEDRDARVIHYRLSGPGVPGPARVTLWLDAQTNLPLKRKIYYEKTQGRITETYTEFLTDPKVDPRYFELPR